MSITYSYISVIILGCLLYVIIFGVYTSRKLLLKSGLYFGVDETAGWKELALSIFSLNVPVEYLLILVLLTFSFWWSGVSSVVIIFLLCSVLLYYFFPKLFKDKFLSSLEIINRSFSKKEKFILSSVTILFSLIFRLALILITSGVLLFHLLGFNYLTFVLLMIIAAGIYSVAGGLISIVKLQLIQLIFIIISVLLICIVMLKDSFIGVFSNTIPDYQHFIELNNITNINLFEAALFIPVFFLWRWYNELDLTKKISSPKINNEGRAIIWSGVLKIFPVLLFLLIGLSVMLFSPDESLDKLLSYILINDHFNLFVRLIVLFTVFSILVQALSSVFISASIQLTKDFLEPFYGIVNSNKLILINRFFISVIVLTTIFIIPFIDLKNIQLYFGVLRYQIFVLAPISALFIIVLFYKNATSRGIIAGFLAGESIIIIRIVIELFLGSHSVISKWFLSIPALQLALFIFFGSAITMLLVSRIKSVSIIPLNHLFRKV